MTHPTTITAEPGLPFVDIVREFDGAPGFVSLGTLTLEEVDGRTRIAIHEVYPSVEARDAAVASGMESGIVEGYERLDELLAR